MKREELEYDEIIAIFEEFGYKEIVEGEGPAEDKNWQHKHEEKA